jgi:pyruvate formate-lyase activating enzyme-like uncharacterized protein
MTRTRKPPLKKPSTNSRLRRLASGKRSKLEERCAEKLSAIGPIEYEVDKIPFVQPAIDRYYLPDWKIADKVYIEAKGRLTLEDRKKMLWVKEQNPDVTVYFIFDRADDKLDKRSKMTKRQWAIKHGFECIDEKESIPRAWFSKLETLSSSKRKLG